MSRVKHLKRPLGRGALAVRLLLRHQTDLLVHPCEHRPKPFGIVGKGALPASARDHQQLVRVTQILLLRAAHGDKRSSGRGGPAYRQLGARI